MSIERRLRKLEPVVEPERREVHRVIVELGETRDEALARHFGRKGAPKGADLILREIIRPPAAVH